MTLSPVLFKGSVKSVRGIEGKIPYVFEYSDSFSVFDWGSMPDSLDGKGEVLTFIGALFFNLLEQSKEWSNLEFDLSDTGTKRVYEKLQKNGLETHCLGQVDNENRVLEIDKYSNLLAVRPVKVIRPIVNDSEELSWDYSAYLTKHLDALVPLEVIFRFGAPKGSSIFKRTSDKNYCKDIGIDDSGISEGDIFENPIIEFSTKLESTDRYLKYDNAKEIAGLSNQEFDDLKNLTKLIALKLKEYLKRIGVELWDGKFEFAFSSSFDSEGNRFFQLVDSIGPDEVRLTYDGVQLSKENLRKYYKDSEWFKVLDDAKQLAISRGIESWKGICIDEFKKIPPRLNDDVKKSFSMMYKSLANELSKEFLGVERYEGAYSLKELVKFVN